ncbi:MAG: very short patch repair endonuclease [Syntrophus sp. (in: bacteria)]|nr:very short patch repair endonuclease [Syntrophus sp. (in: bacteria)]
MTDRFQPAKRSEIMSRIKGWDTEPEKTVRSLLHRLGYRFRLHVENLPGKPDIVMPKHKAVLFVHGCFWHGHKGCRRATRPSTNVDFWNDKIEANVCRDAEATKQLEAMGWRVLVVWQCRLRDKDKLASELVRLIVGR